MEKIIKIQLMENKDIEISSGESKLLIQYSDKKLEAQKVFELLEYSDQKTYKLDPVALSTEIEKGDKEYFEELSDVLSKIIDQVNEINSTKGSEDIAVDPIAN